MVEPPVPVDEERRLRRLHALVGLVDVHRQWFKSCVGLDRGETDRSLTFCGQPLLTTDGSAVGTLCIIDREPRTFTDDDRSIARQHGGDVTVTSQLGAGSTFRLAVPRPA